MENLKGLWLAEPVFLQGYLERIVNATAEDRKQAEAFFDNPNMSTSAESEYPEILSFEGEEALIKISGALSRKGPSRLSRYFGCDGTGYNDIIESLEIASDNESVKTIRLLMNTPGGTVDGADETFQAVMSAKKKKKVIAENHGLIASAGYWIAAGANKIIAASPANETGSIGVAFASYDFSKYLEAEGIKRVVIVSKNAPDKIPDIAKKSGKDIIQERIDALERVFISRIAEGRGLSIKHIQERFGKGGVLIAQDPENNIDDALSVQMIDKVQSIISADVGGEPQEIDANNQVGSLSGTSNTTIKSSIQKKEKRHMDLAKAIAENPGIQAEVNALVLAGFNKGATEANEANTKLINSCAPYLDAKSAYPGAVMALAVNVITGKAELPALQGAVTVWDATQETSANAAAVEETNNAGETPVDPQAPVSADGAIKNETDMQAAADRLKQG